MKIIMVIVSLLMGEVTWAAEVKSYGLAIGLDNFGLQEMLNQKRKEFPAGYFQLAIEANGKKQMIVTSANTFFKIDEIKGMVSTPTVDSAGRREFRETETSQLSLLIEHGYERLKIPFYDSRLKRNPQLAKFDLVFHGVPNTTDAGEPLPPIVDDKAKVQVVADEDGNIQIVDWTNQGYFCRLGLRKFNKKSKLKPADLVSLARLLNEVHHRPKGIKPRFSDLSRVRQLKEVLSRDHFAIEPKGEGDCKSLKDFLIQLRDRTEQPIGSGGGTPKDGTTAEEAR